MVSVLIVNYNVAFLLKNLVESLILQKEKVELIIVDNASQDSYLLSDIKDAKIIYNRKNLGFSKAVNQAYRESKGDFILIVNPDVVFLEGAIKSLKFLARQKEVGAVGPKTWWDEQKTFLLPPVESQELYKVALYNLAERQKALANFLSRRWIRRAIKYWLAKEALEIDHLSGGCFLTRREVIEKIGLFDERFFLYFEDTDWFKRVRKAGYKIFYQPKSEICHFYNQSASKLSNAHLLFRNSAQLYWKKWYNKGIIFILKKFINIVENFPLANFGSIYLGKRHSPFSLKIPYKEYLLQFGVNPLFIPFAGCFVKSSTFFFPEKIWEKLANGLYFLRALSLDDYKILGTWHFEKV